MAIDYVVPGLIIPVRQPSGMSCWAAMFTMMYSWRNNVSISIPNAVATLGQHYLNVLLADTGLSINDNRALAQAAGMTAEPLQNWTVEGWYRMLACHGLLWTSYAWQSGERRGRHIIIFYGLKTGPGDVQNVLYVDPADGQKHEMSFETALGQHELGFTISPLTDTDLGQFSQVIHY